MTDRDNRNALWNGLPTWIKAVAMVGFPIVVSLFFMARESGWIPSVHRDIDVTIKANAVELVNHERTQRELTDRLMTGIRILCENAADTPTNRNNCGNIK